MTTMIQGRELRAIALGRGPVEKAVAYSTAATYQLFTVTGGRVLITALWGVVTTAMTGANTINLQTDPTTGDTIVVVTATDLGTTDTAAGTTIGVTGNIADPASTGADFATVFARGGRALRDLVVTTGEIESVGTEGTINGAITWYCCWIPLDDGAELVASA
jgi:hypothetical protein